MAAGWRCSAGASGLERLAGDGAAGAASGGVAGLRDSDASDFLLAASRGRGSRSFDGDVHAALTSLAERMDADEDRVVGIVENAIRLLRP